MTQRVPAFTLFNNSAHSISSISSLLCLECDTGLTFPLLLAHFTLNFLEENLVNDWYSTKENKQLPLSLVCTSLILFTLPDAFGDHNFAWCFWRLYHTKRETRNVPSKSTCSIICMQQEKVTNRQQVIKNILNSSWFFSASTELESERTN